MKAFQAYAKGASVTGITPRAAARKFFERFPERRKCNVTEGETDGMFFTVRYGRNERPQRWTDVTKKMVETLPENIFIKGTGEPIAAIEAPTN